MTTRRFHRARARAALPAATLVLLAVSAALLPASAVAATLFGLIDTGELYASTNGGTSWTIRSTLPVRDAVGLIGGTSSTQLFLASESGSIYRSDDAGVSWTGVGAVSASDVTALLGAPGELLLFTASGSVYRSTDSGVSFTAVGTVTASDVVSATRQSGALFVATRTGSVYRSDDDGASFTAVGTVTTSELVEIVGRGGNLNALTASGDVARSANGGVSWSFIGTLSQSGTATLLATETELLASTESGETAASPDGVSWSWRGAIGQLTLRALADDSPVLVGVGVGPAGHLAFLPPAPNPASVEAVLGFVLEHESVVSVTVHDLAGRKVASPLRAEVLPAGRSLRSWRPGGLPPGLYRLRARIDGREESRPFVWLGPR